MEEFFIVIFQFVFEGLGQALLELFGEWAVTSNSEKTSTRILVVLGAIFFGIGVGFLTIQIFPESLIHYAWLRCLNLLIAPLIAYWISKFISKIRNVETTTSKLIFSVIFTFSLVAVRLAYVAE